MQWNNPALFPCSDRAVVVPSSWDGVYWQGNSDALDAIVRGPDLMFAEADTDGIVRFDSPRRICHAALDRDGGASRAFAVIDETFPSVSAPTLVTRPGHSHAGSAIGLYRPLRLAVLLSQQHPHRGARPVCAPVRPNGLVSWELGVLLDHIELTDQDAAALTAFVDALHGGDKSITAV